MSVRTYETPGDTAPNAGWATKADVAYATIRAKLLDGTLAPGGVVDQDVLARELDLSTTPLREALRRLEAEKLLHQVAHREMRVPDLSARELDELYTVRIKLDPYAAKLGAQRADEHERGMVRSLREPPARATTAELVVWHRKLHRVMYAAAGNTVLTGLLDALWDRSDRYRFILIGSIAQSGQGISGQLDTVEAFLEGKGSLVAKLLRQDLTASRDTLLKVLSDGRG